MLVAHGAKIVSMVSCVSGRNWKIPLTGPVFSNLNWFCCSVSKKGSCEFLFVFIIWRKVYFAFYNGINVAEQILPRLTQASLELLMFEEN